MMCVRYFNFSQELIMPRYVYVPFAICCIILLAYEIGTGVDTVTLKGQTYNSYMLIGLCVAGLLFAFFGSNKSDNTENKKEESEKKDEESE